MPPKKATGSAPKKATGTPAAHASYRDMIKEAIMALKERNGSSRVALKKYILANNKNVSPGAAFDTQFNRAVKSGVEKEEFAQPKGSSGTVKLAKPAAAAAKPATKPAASASKPAAAKKAPATKTKTATKATTTKVKKPTVAKKTGAKPGPKSKAPKAEKTPKSKPAPKPTSNTGAKRATKKAPTAAPAVVDTPQILGKTKSGRVTKGPAKTAKPSVKKAKAATKKAVTPKKSATPKKTATPAAA